MKCTISDNMHLRELKQKESLSIRVPEGCKEAEISVNGGTIVFDIKKRTNQFPLPAWNRSARLLHKNDINEIDLEEINAIFLYNVGTTVLISIIFMDDHGCFEVPKVETN